MVSFVHRHTYMRQRAFLLPLLLMSLGCANDATLDFGSGDENSDEIGSSAQAVRLGGFMSDCYIGSGFEVDKECNSVEASTSLESLNGGSMLVSTSASGYYTSEDGQNAEVRMQVTLEDYTNFFNPEAEVPVIFRSIVCSGRLNCSYYVVSDTVILERDFGTRTLRGRASISLQNSWGSEHTERVEKVEVLVPGANSMAVLNF